MRTVWMLMIVVAGMILLAGTAFAQESALDDPILIEAGELFADASFVYSLDLDIDMDGTELEANGTGAVQAPSDGFLSIGAKSRGIHLALNGAMDFGRADLPIDIETVAMGSSLYMRGLISDEWVQTPSGVLGGRSVVNPNRVDSSFIKVTREADDTIDGAPMAVFSFDYDLSNATAQSMIAGTTSGIDSIGGIIATGQQAADVFAQGDLGMVQYIDLNTKIVRRIVIEFDLDDTHLDAQIDLPEGYSTGITVTAPADARSLNSVMSEAIE